jgi:hypothetical protein
MISKLRKPMIALSIAIYICCFITAPAVARMMGPLHLLSILSK